jgi:hypothetical protein
MSQGAGGSRQGSPEERRSMQRLRNRSVAPLCAIDVHSGYPAQRFGPDESPVCPETARD